MQHTPPAPARSAPPRSPAVAVAVTPHEIETTRNAPRVRQQRSETSGEKLGGLAVASLVLGLASLLLAALAGLPAIVLGLRGRRCGGRTIATAGAVLGLVGTLLTPLYLLALFVIVRNNLETANYNASMGNMGTLVGATCDYYERNKRWPDRIDEISPFLRGPRTLAILLNNPLTGDNPGYEYIKPPDGADRDHTVILVQVRSGQRELELPVGFAGRLVTTLERAGDPRFAAEQERLRHALSTLPRKTPAPSFFPGLSSSSSADYCTLLLAPKLSEELGISPRRRVVLGVQSASLVNQLNASTGRFNMVHKTIQQNLEKVLESEGAKAKALLTSAEDAAFRNLKSSGRIQPVQIRVSSAGVGFGGSPYIVVYTPYGDEELAANSKNVIRSVRPWSKEEILQCFKSVADAKETLQDTNPDVQSSGATWLLTANPKSDPDRRATAQRLFQLIDANTSSTPDYLKGVRYELFVKAYCHWCDAAGVPALQKLARIQGMSSAAWQPAMLGLIRVDPDAAIAMIDERGKDFFFRAAAFGALHGLGKEGEPILIRLVGSPLGEVRGAAEHILKSQGFAVPDVPKLPPVVAQPLPATPGASEAPKPVAEKLPASELENALASLKHKDQWRQYSGSQWFNKAPRDQISAAGAREAKDLLFGLLQTDNQIICDSFSRAFARLAGPDDVARLDQMLRWEEKFYSCWGPAAVALLQIDPRRALPHIERHIDFFSFKVYFVTELTKWNSGREAEVFPLLGSKKLSVKLEACGVLAEIGTSQSIVAMQKSLASTRIPVEQAHMKQIVEPAIRKIKSRAK